MQISKLKQKQQKCQWLSSCFVFFLNNINLYYKDNYVLTQIKSYQYQCFQPVIKQNKHIMFPIQIPNLKPNQLLRASSESQEDEGFQQKQPFVLEIMTSILGMHDPSIQVPTKRKNIFRNALSLYTANSLFNHSQSINKIPDTVQSLKIKVQKENDKIQKVAEIASHADPNSRLSQFTVNKKMICIYNRHNQNLASKNDMTIFIKNIKLALQNDMLNPFDQTASQMLTLTSPSASQVKFGVYSKFRLQFYSNFEGGNLHSVFWEQNTNKYFLFLQNDINTHGYNQWFGFCVQALRNSSLQTPYDEVNGKQHLTVSGRNNRLKKAGSLNSNLAKSFDLQSQKRYTANIIIVNISKDIKYKNSMRVLTFSKNGWSCNTPFIYYKNKFQRYSCSNYHTLQFQYNFQVAQAKKGSQQNLEYFYLTYPYSYTKLVKFCREIKTDQKRRHKIQIQSIGKSEGNNQIYMMSFLNTQNKQDRFKLNTNPGTQQIQQFRKTKKMINKIQKQCIIVIARQHSGQTVSSFVCEHLINQIMNSSSNSNDYFNWFVIPMANPDGVIHGNTRTNLKGYDINRCWLKNTINFCTEVEAINKTIEEIKQKYTVRYIIDLHGHSKDFGAFGYFSEDNDTSRVINFLISQGCSYFNYYRSKYGIDYKKRPTFRGQMYYRNQIKNSITIQISLFGYKQIGQTKNVQIKPFVQSHFKKLAKAIYKALIQFQDIKQTFQNHSNTKESVKGVMKKIQELQRARLKMGQSLQGSSSNDSDSDPEDQYLEKIQRVSIGIDIKEQVSQDQGQHSSFYKKSFKINNEGRYNQKIPYTQSQKIKQKQKIRTQLLHRYNAFNKMTKERKAKRKPIYTNSNVEILNFSKMEQLDKSIKKFSYDQTYEQLSQKTLSDLKQTKKKRTNLSASQRKINGHYMRSKQSLIYPTASNIKIDLQKASSEQETNAIYYSTRLWDIKQKNIADCIRKCKKQRPKSLIHYQEKVSPKRLRTLQADQKRKQSHNELLKLKQFLLSKTKPKISTPQNMPEKSGMSKTMLNIVCKRIA